MATFVWNQWQFSHGISGNFAVESVATFAWNTHTEGYNRLNQVEAGFNALNEALEVMERTGERWYEAELHRLRGQLLLQQSSDSAPEAETCFHQAISIAQNQNAKSWELRAATSLARLWKSQCKLHEAHDLLAPVYDWFTEGHDTADLIDAKALLDDLEEGQF